MLKKRVYKRSAFMILFVITFILCIPNIVSAYDLRDDNRNSMTVSPGYLNAAKFKTDTIVKSSGEKISIGQKIDRYVRNLLSTPAESEDDVKVKLKGKGAVAESKSKIMTTQIDPGMSDTEKEFLETLTDLGFDGYKLPVDHGDLSSHQLLDPDNVLSRPPAPIRPEARPPVRLRFRPPMISTFMGAIEPADSGIFTPYDDNFVGPLGYKDYIAQAAWLKARDVLTGKIELGADSKEELGITSNPVLLKPQVRMAEKLELDTNDLGSRHEKESILSEQALGITGFTVKSDYDPVNKNPNFSEYQTIKNDISEKNIAVKDKNPLSVQKKAEKPLISQQEIVSRAMENYKTEEVVVVEHGDPIIQAQFKESIINFVDTYVMPKLLQAQDVYTFMAIFGKLQENQNMIIDDYGREMGAYYKDVIAVLTEDIQGLCASNIFEKALSKKDLDSLPRKEIDRIITRLKAKADKGERERDLLDKVESYKEKHIVAANAKMKRELESVFEKFCNDAKTMLYEQEPEK